MRPLSFIFCAALASLIGSTALAADDGAPAAPTFALTDKNVAIDAGVAGTFHLSLPNFREIKGGGGKPADVNRAADRKSITFTYPAGGKGKVELVSADTIRISLSDLPAEAAKARIDMQLPGLLNDGGRWAVDDGALQDFPKEKPEKPFLYQGNARSFTLLHPTGAGFRLDGFIQGTYQQLQDNREWNHAIFSWYASMPLPRGNPTPVFTIRLSRPGEAAAKIQPLIDRFGQFVSAQFDTKVTSEQELKDDVKRDEEYYGALNPPPVDRFGGLPGSGKELGLRATGFFRIEKVNDRLVMVDPEGNLFFQLGVCVFAMPCDDYTTVRGREEIYEWLPKADEPGMKSAWRNGDSGIVSFYLANRVRKYGRPHDSAFFVSQSIERIRKWGFNSAGAFSSWDEAGKAEIEKASLPQVPTLPLGKVAPILPGTKVWDPFAEDVERKIDEAFDRVAARADDPLIIGWFIVNEPAIEDVPKLVPTLKGSKWAAKRRLVQLLRETYPTIEAFNAAWELKAASFDELVDLPLPVATRAAARDMQAYFELFLETRYSLVDKAFRAHDPNHLLLGDRWMPSTANNETLVRIAGKYLDVISVNYYAAGIERAFLDRLHRWSGGKPLLLSEFYYSCRDQGLAGGGTRVNDQVERGLAYRNYVEQSAATGYVVGIQWFSHVDQAPTGRFFQGFNGEAFNNGLVNVADRPYKPFLAEVMKTNWSIYDVLLGKREPFAYDNPRFAGDGARAVRTVAVTRMTNTVILDGQRTEWPTVPPTRIGADRLVRGPHANDFDAAYRVAWDDDNLYLFVEVTDTTPMSNRRADDRIWADDGVELFIGPENLDQGGTLQFGDRQVLIRAHAPDPELAPAHFINAPRPCEAQVAVVPAVDGRGYVIEAAIPFEALGFTPKPGQEVLFDLSINDGGGGRRTLAWNGTARNSSDRGAWGRAEFTN